jgi:hypothetical protein
VQWKREMPETIRISLVLLVVGGALWAASAIPHSQAIAERMVSAAIVLAGVAWLLGVLASY